MKEVKELSNTPEALKIVLQHCLGINYFDSSDIFMLRCISRSFLRKINTQSLFFQREVFEKALIKNITPELPALKTIDALPSFEKALLSAVTQNDKSLLKDYLKEFFSLMVSYVGKNPQVVCRLVELSKQMGLVAEDFRGLGNEVVQLFAFLTQPITDTSQENEALLLSYISNLSLCHHYVHERLCKNLRYSINSTFAFLRGEPYANNSHLYVNLSEANFEAKNLRGANLEAVNLAGANLRGANLQRARLINANLEGADLRGANLFRASCDGIRLRRADLRGAIFIGERTYEFKRADFDGAEFFDDASVEGFKEQILSVVELFPPVVFQIFFSMQWEKLSEKDSSELRRLNEYMREAISVFAISIQELSELFSNIKAADHIFANIYPELLELIAKAYIKFAYQFDYKALEKDKEFKEKLVAEIHKQKNANSIHNAGWDSVLDEISKASLSSANLNNNNNNLCP